MSRHVMRRVIGGGVLLLALSIGFAVLSIRPASAAKQGNGQEIFRYDTFDDEQLWTDVLRIHEALEELTPLAALSAGLKVDADALPAEVIALIEAGQLDVNDPAVTRTLLDLNAVVGIVANVNNRKIKSVGITCALCHSTVDDSIDAGIGRRLDGWPNLDLDVGAIVSLAPGLPDVLRPEFQAWGPGKYDPRHHAFDGRNIIPLNSPSLPVVIPPVYGLEGVGFETFTGDGPVSYWNAYVGISQMGGKGTFNDPRIGVFIRQRPDRVTPKLQALLEYQLSLDAPAPPPGFFDGAAAARGEELFEGAAQCSTCHIPPTYTDVLSGPDPDVPVLHSALEIGSTSGYEERSATGMFRATPLRGLWQHAPYFHDGRAADLLAVVNHYVDLKDLVLTEQQKADLVEFLKSL